MSRPALRAVAALAFLFTITDPVLPQPKPTLRDLDTASDLGNKLREQGKLPEAIAAYQKAIEISMRLFGFDAPEIAPYLNNQAVAYRENLQYEKALPPTERALRILEEEVAKGNAHPDFLIGTSLNAGNLYADLGQLAIAAAHLKRACDYYDKHYPRIDKRAGAHLNLSTVYREMGDYDKALEHARIAFDHRAATLGPGHPNYWNAYMAVADVYWSRKEYAKAEAAYRQNLEAWEKNAGKGQAPSAMTMLARGLVPLGKFDEAEQLLTDAIKIRTSWSLDSHANVAELALVQAYQGKSKEAVALLNRCLPELRRVPAGGGGRARERATVVAAALHRGDALRRAGHRRRPGQRPGRGRGLGRVGPQRQESSLRGRGRAHLAGPGRPHAANRRRSRLARRGRAEAAVGTLDRGVAELHPGVNGPEDLRIERVRNPTTPLDRFLPLVKWAGPVLKELAGAETETYTGDQATEERIKLADAPRFALFGTHGTFPAVDPKVVRPGLGLLAENPLLRCRLVFAGCDRKPRSGVEDGHLFGLEILDCNFLGTELVVLAACQSAEGDIHAGQAAVGIRSAFLLAGARAVEATLWSVDVGSTIDFTATFFEGLREKKSKSEAIRLAMNAVRAKWQKDYGSAHPYYWSPYTLTIRGRRPDALRGVEYPYCPEGL